MEDLRVAEYPGMHRYAPPQGMPALLDAIVERVRARTGVAHRARQRPGGDRRHRRARGGGGSDRGARGRGAAARPPLAADHRHRAVVRRRAGRRPLLRRRRFPGDRGRGGARAPHRAHRRPLPQHPEQPGRPADPALLDRGAGRAGPPARTSGSSPTRSTRTTSSRASTPTPARSRPSAPSPPTPSPRPTAWRATAAATWWGRPRRVRELRKIGMHSFYSTPTASQIAALRVIGGAGDAWIAARPGAVQGDRRRRWRPAWGCRRRWGAPSSSSTSPRSSTRPGSAASSSAASTAASSSPPARASAPIPTHVRLCFTAAPPDAIERGVEALAPLLGH